MSGQSILSITPPSDNIPASIPEATTASVIPEVATEISTEIPTEVIEATAASGLDQNLSNHLADPILEPTPEPIAPKRKLPDLVPGAAKTISKPPAKVLKPPAKAAADKSAPVKPLPVKLEIIRVAPAPLPLPTPVVEVAKVAEVAIAPEVTPPPAMVVPVVVTAKPPQPEPAREVFAAPKAFSTADFANALNAHSYQFSVGQVVNGRVVQHESRGAYVDIGGKSPGFLPLEEAVLGGAVNLEEALPVDTKRDFVIIRDQDADGSVTLSVRSFLMKQAWTNLRQFQSKNQTFNCKILEGNTGGLVVSAQGWRGFVPRSHLNDKNTDVEQLIGKTLPVVVLELDEERSKLVLSNRLAVRASALSQLQKGQLVTGTVSSLRPFGAFVELGGMSGLLHVKEISQKYIGNVETVFKPGDVIKVVVLDVDESRQRIALSTKILEMHSGEILENAAQVFEEAEERLEKNISKLWDA